MYGDCQVMSSMGGGNIVSSDSFFSSPIQSPNLQFMSNMPFHSFSNIIPKEEMGLMRGKEDEMESGSGSGPMEGGGSGEEQENEQKPKKKRYHRHTARQIQEMESLFKDCPHPDEKQRQKLSQDLGLKPRQVKFWFQNRRTQMKAQQDRSDNLMLRAENESLKNENFRLQAAIRNVMCPNCGGPAILGEVSLEEQHLRLENARLKEELDRLSCITSRYSNRPLHGSGPAPPLLVPSLDLDMGVYSRYFNDPSQSCNDIIQAPPMPENQPLAGGGILEHEKEMAVELAMAAANELVRMCRTNEPLWVRNSNGTKETLDVAEHGRMFPWPMNLKHNHGQSRTEATRDSAPVIINSITLVDAFLDANKWMELFPSIVSRARTIQNITQGVSGHGNGSLQLMYAELQVLTPLVPTREAYFLRYCQQIVEEGLWVIVDFPIYGFHNCIPPTFPSYRRRPSGCLIQDMPNGYSKVTWIEHAEVEEKPVHQIFSGYVNSRMAFGAQRWVAILQSQCERLASLMARNIPDLGVIPTPEARKNMMKLSQRMIRTFCFNISVSGGQTWTALSDSSNDTIRITTRKNMDPGQPSGIILTAVSTTWLPFSHHQVFDLLRDEQRRSEIHLDTLSSGSSLHEVAHIANGSHPGNCISLLRINATSNSSQQVELILQESCTDPSSSLIVYATVDVNAIQVAMSGEDPSFIPLLPIGFVVLPAGPNGNSSGDNGDSVSPSNNGNGQDSGCLLTVGLQVLASTVPTGKLNLSSVSAINNHICNVVHQISAALSRAGGGVCAASDQ